MMKKIATYITLVVLSIVSISGSVMAVDINSAACQDIPDAAVCVDSRAGRTNNPLFGEEGILTRAISILSIVIGIIAVIVLIIAGIRFAVSQGNPQSVQNVRNTVIYAVVGIVVALMSQAIVQLVLSRLPD